MCTSTAAVFAWAIQSAKPNIATAGTTATTWRCCTVPKGSAFALTRYTSPSAEHSRLPMSHHRPTIHHRPADRDGSRLAPGRLAGSRPPAMPLDLDRGTYCRLHPSTWASASTCHRSETDTCIFSMGWDPRTETTAAENLATRTHGLPQDLPM